MQTLFTNKIKMIDKKYFHKTEYAYAFKLQFNVELLHNEIQFNTTYYSYKTLIEFNNLLSYYQLSKNKTDKAIKIFEICIKNINSKIQKCYDKYCVEIYKYLIDCYEEILETKKLGKKPNWNFFVKSIKPYIENVKDRMLLIYNKPSKVKIIQEKDAVYSIKDEIDFEDIKNTYLKIYSNTISGKEFIFFYDLLYLYCRIYDLLYNVLDLNVIFNDEDILDYLDKNKQSKTTINKIVNQFYKNTNTITIMLNAFFDEYKEPISNNDEIINTYNILKVIQKSIKENDVSVAKLLIKEILHKHKEFLVEGYKI